MMDWETFKAAYDASVIRWAQDDPEGHTARVLFDALESHMAELRKGLRQIGDEVHAAAVAAQSGTPPPPPNRDPNSELGAS